MKRLMRFAVILMVMLGILPGTTLARQVEELPLSEEGMYTTGLQLLTFVDEVREDREVQIAIFYPAVEPEDTSARDTAELLGAPFSGFRDAEPDMAEAPYPLILFSPDFGVGELDWVNPLRHLASHGFVVASIDHACSSNPTCLIDRPLDIVFVLNELATLGDSSLVGVIDAEHTGVLGQGIGGYTALAAGGARIDPVYFQEWVDNRDTTRPVSPDYFSELYGWNLVTGWNEIASYRAHFDAQTEGEPWLPIMDSRVRAIMPLTPSFGMLYGERGLETVTVPTMIMAITAHLAISYEDEVVPVYSILAMEQGSMITLVDYAWAQLGHIKWPHPQEEAYYKHFSTAFFGYYLQGQENYSDYLTQNFVESYDDLIWGVRDDE